MGNNITYTINCNYRIVVTLCYPRNMFFFFQTYNFKCPAYDGGGGGGCSVIMGGMVDIALVCCTKSLTRQFGFI